MSNKMQLYTVYLYLLTALHVSGGISSHHQELMSLYPQHLELVKPWLQPVVNVTGRKLQFPSSPECKSWSKGKDHPKTGHEVPEGGNRVIALLHPLTSALDGVGG